ncbi:unnamed protein product [Triticum turgidum subsp. durum]|uniref:Uncharacterized protein n=1 Tax=Triticum turgidum subsp. durum TaxID=4567 RepID=A0A9R0ZMU4_TRITD|nr:unnamed protein product [Triticum turgidum subsp. durum]
MNGTAAPHSTWQSPVPYLFGGLAAMLGLIALALLILACSYWKLSGYLDGDRDGQAAGDADGEKGSASGAARPAMDFLEHVVEKKVDEQGCEVISQLGGDPADSASRSRDRQDAASHSHDNHHHHDHESSSTTALQESSQ